MIKYISLILFGQIILLTVSAQNLKQDVQDARAAYANLDKLHVVILVQAFDKEHSLKPYYTASADIKRDKENYLYHFGDNEMLLNAKYLVVVDNELKEISCDKRDLKNVPAAFKDPMQVNFDSVLNYYESQKFMGLNNDLKHYRLSPKAGDVKFIDLYLHLKSKLIYQIEYHYKEGQVVKVDFKVFDRNPEFTPLTFSETQYGTVTKNKFVTQGRFKNYRISNVENR